MRREERTRRPMYPETACYVANYILSKPSLSIYEPLYVRRYHTHDLEPFSTPHQGRNHLYWVSPQRSQASGSSWSNPRRRHLVVPGNTGFSDVYSTQSAGCCRMHHTLVWKYRWLKLRERMRTYLR